MNAANNTNLQLIAVNLAFRDITGKGRNPRKLAGKRDGSGLAVTLGIDLAPIAAATDRRAAFDDAIRSAGFMRAFELTGSTEFMVSAWSIKTKAASALGKADVNAFVAEIYNF
jgi:hypothetical protein